MDPCDMDQSDMNSCEMDLRDMDQYDLNSCDMDNV